MEHNGQVCLYVVPPSKIVFDEVENDLGCFTRLRQLKDCTIWMRLSLLLEWLIVVVKINKMISTYAVSLVIRASKVANRPLSSAILNLKVSFKTGPKFLT